jgi:hypothetical protein
MPVMPNSLVADGALAGALAVHAELLARLRRVDAPTPPWWFGYARDGTNLSALLIGWGAYLGFGFTPAVAFLASGLTVLVTYILDWVVARGFRLRRARLILGVLLASWVAFVAFRSESIGHGFERLVAAVQPVSR